jgi:general secretion pathway protein A
MYERFFGLADLPFRLTPDPRYLFLSSRHADALAHLTLGLTESSGFVCITGDVGTGKTTLLRHFLAGLAADVHTAYVFNPALTSLELLQTINAEFGLPAASASKTELIAALNARLVAEHAAGRRSLVVIDEAQALDLAVLEQLRLLSNLETTTEKLLRIILVGQPQLRGLLQHPDLTQLNQRITLRWHIGPLAPAETAAYVRHRIDVAAGTGGRQLFSRGALRRLHRYSGGVPRLINMIAHRALIAAFADERQRVSTRLVDRAHRELSTVPLPGRRRRPLGPVAAALGAGAALGVSLVLSARLLLDGWRSDVQPDAVAAPATLASLVPADAIEAPPPSPVPLDVVDAERRLAAAGGGASARDAFAAITRVWGVAEPTPDEGVAASAFDRLARERGVEHVTLEANGSMLRLLDVPAILELHFPAGVGPRFAALVGAVGDGWVLDLAGTKTRVDDAFLARHWFGQAHLFWLDDERFGTTALARGTTGDVVARLQEAMSALGAYDGAASGTFDSATESAVRAFQRAQFLEPDGVVGPLTKLAVNAARHSDRPSLSDAGSPDSP